jgi:hypothetical protein
MILVSGRGRRLTTTVALGAPLLVVGGYWYLRAAIKTGGNPIPQLGWGPLDLPRPDQMPLDPRPRFSVADYLFEPTIYRKWFFPQLDNALGPLFPLILVMAFAAVVYIAIRARNKVLRVLAAAALLTAVVYVFTPLTAAGQEGSPTGFFTNTRYLMPGLLLALVMLPIARPLRAPDLRAWQTLLFLTGVFAITVLTTPRWYAGYIVGTVFLTLALVWTPAGLGWLRGEGRIGRAGVAAAVAGVVVLGVVLGRAQQVQYSENHYTQTTFFLQDGGPQEAYDFARERHDTRIAIAGSGEMFFGQYGYYGADLSNRVQYIGVPGPDGEYRLPTTCREFRREINAGDYDYLIMSQYTQDSRDSDYWYPILAWVKDDPALDLVLEEPEITPQPDYVFKVNGPLAPDRCADVGKGASS